MITNLGISHGREDATGIVWAAESQRDYSCIRCGSDMRTASARGLRRGGQGSGHSCAFCGIDAGGQVTGSTLVGASISQSPSLAAA